MMFLSFVMSLENKNSREHDYLDYHYSHIENITYPDVTLNQLIEGVWIIKEGL